MRISDWSSDVCSSDLAQGAAEPFAADFAGAVVVEFDAGPNPVTGCDLHREVGGARFQPGLDRRLHAQAGQVGQQQHRALVALAVQRLAGLQRREHRAHARLVDRSEEHTSELQSLMRISYAVFCLKKKNTNHANPAIRPTNTTY